MAYTWKYKTSNGYSNIYMNSDGECLTGLWFEGSRDMSKHELKGTERLVPVLEETCEWLDEYFRGIEPTQKPAYKIENITPFRKQVIEEMNRIPYGKVITYNDIARSLAKKRGIERMSAQAVGGAVGWNPICIIIPCHRVVGSNGSLTGYGGGINNKYSLLQHEGLNMHDFYIPSKGTAL